MLEWVARGMLALACAACYLGFALLALALRRHWEAVTGQRELPPALPRVLRALGSVGLAAGLGLALWRDGASFGSVLWVTLLAAAGLAMVFTLAWRPRWLRPLATASLRLIGGRGARSRATHSC
jgi:Protein of unknown function (DUF3325)